MEEQGNAQTSRSALFNGLQSFVDKEVEPQSSKSWKPSSTEMGQRAIQDFLSGLRSWLLPLEALHRAIDEHVQWSPNLGDKTPYLSDEFHSYGTFAES